MIWDVQKAYVIDTWRRMWDNGEAGWKRRCFLFDYRRRYFRGDWR